MTMTTNDNTNTNTSDNEQQTAGLKIHHVSSPWHDHHVTMSPFNMSSPLPSPSPHSCFHKWSVSDSQISFFHITNNINNNCLLFAHLVSPFIHCTQYYTHILRVSFLTFFSSFFYILIILSIRSTPPHHHYQYLQPTPNKIDLRHVCISSLRFFFFFIYIVLIFIYCHHQTHHNGHHILMIATSPPHQHSQWQKGLDLLLETYLEPLVSFFFFLLFLQY